MGTPIGDKLWSDFTSVQKSSEWRGRLEIRREVIAVLKTVRKPTVAVRELLERLEVEESGK